MNKPDYPHIPSSEITPKKVYLSRRDFINAAGCLPAAWRSRCGVKAARNLTTQPQLLLRAGTAHPAAGRRDR